MRQSDGKTEFLDPTCRNPSLASWELAPQSSSNKSSHKFAKTRSSNAARRETHAGMFFFDYVRGSARTGWAVVTWLLAK
eukprot:7387586-Prymnesium_polylepis.1